jgi:hypothetical protein
MSLIDECIEALSDSVHILTESDRDQVLNEFENSFPFTKWGRIDWEKMTCHAVVNTVDDIISFLKQKTNKYSNDVYVIWDEGTLPIIQTNLDKVLEAIDDVTAVSFDTWIFASFSGFVIEVFHDGEVRVGILKN